nr:glycosyltransferase [Lysinibacillus timonensis]
MNIIEAIMWFFGIAIIIYMLIVIVTYFCMLFFAIFEIRKISNSDQSNLTDIYLDSFYSKPVSIIVPVYNEELGIVHSTYSLLNLRYPESEIIIVNDGSTDQTQAKLIEHFKMKPISKVVREQIKTKDIKQIFQSQIHPQCILVEKENGGKADALNVGINVSKYPYFCSIDGDSILEESSLMRVMKPIILNSEEVIAVGGNVRIANGMDMQYGSVFETALPNNYLIIMQVIEYLRAFLMGRIALSKFNIVLIISGAFSVFSKKWVVKVGGYSTGTIGEDMELVVKLHRQIREEGLKKRIEFLPDPVCWTEAPQTMNVLRKQRKRWHQGLIESLWKHRKMTLNPRYGGIGLISFPYYWLIECIGPIIELGGYIYVVVAFFLGSVYYEFSILLLLLFVINGVIFSMIAVLFEVWSRRKSPNILDLLRMVILSFTEIAWYRPFTLFWRCEGFIKFLTRNKEWGDMERKGISKKENLL